VSAENAELISALQPDPDVDRNAVGLDAAILADE